jgi:hypothetical protein
MTEKVEYPNFFLKAQNSPIMKTLAFTRPVVNLFTGFPRKSTDPSWARLMALGVELSYSFDSGTTLLFLSSRS